MTLSLPLSEFFNTNEFAESVTFTPRGGIPSTIALIDDSAFSAINLDNGMQANNTNFVKLAKTSDLTNKKVKGGTITTSSGQTFYIQDKQQLPDDEGMTVLILSKDPVI